MTNVPITVVETPSFLADAKRLMNDSERLSLITFLAQNPNSGDLIQGTGGIRKVRFAKHGKGKSGGFRVVYFFYSTDIPLFALNIFSKNEKSNITQTERNTLKELTAKLVGSYHSRR